MIPVVDRRVNGTALFPLHAVLCPGIVMPLHIFEDRYRALTRHCIETGSPFGIVLIREGLEAGASPSLAVAGVGAVAEIREASRYADGRYDCSSRARAGSRSRTSTWRAPRTSSGP